MKVQKIKSCPKMIDKKEREDKNVHTSPKICSEFLQFSGNVMR